MANSPIQVAVMGPTGAGKSTFIKLLTSDEKIRVGHGQESETSEIQTSTYFDQGTGRSIMFIDTPGFDDSSECVTDTDILEIIARFLEPEHGQRRKLNGIIYMHRISDPRVSGVSRKNLRMFQSLCGEENLKNIYIVTTNWGRVSEEEGNRREADLKNGVFKALVDAGAQMRRHTNTLDSARQIVSEIIPLGAVTMKIQEELRGGKKLEDTSAGRVLTIEIQEMQKRHEQEMAGVKKQVEQATRAMFQVLAAKAEQERKDLEGRISLIGVNRVQLERTLEEQRRLGEAKEEEGRKRIIQMNQQLDMQRNEAQAQKERADRAQCQLKNDAKQKQINLELQLAEIHRRIAELEASGNSGGGGCIIC